MCGMRLKKRISSEKLNWGYKQKLSPCNSFVICRVLSLFWTCGWSINKDNLVADLCVHCLFLVVCTSCCSMRSFDEFYTVISLSVPEVRFFLTFVQSFRSAYVQLCNLRFRGHSVLESVNVFVFGDVK